MNEYIVNNKKLIIYKCTSRKVISAAATQYMIDRFSLKKIVVEFKKITGGV